ncbi:MAG: hypothetical protein RLZZ387_944, partial [Chloroflexota bacterium]
MRESSPSHTISPSLGVDGPTGVAPRFGLWRRGWPLLVLALLLCAALNLPATLKYSPASVDEPPVYVRFWPPEGGESLTYRWSRGGSGLRLYGLEAVDGALVTLRLTAPQGGAAGPSLLTLALGERALGTVEAPPAWRTYRVLVPAEGEGWRAPLLRLEGDTRRAGPGDSREIGVAVSALSAAPLGRMAPLAAAERWAYLCTLLSGLLLWLWRLAPPRLPGLVAVVLATCAAAAAVLAPAWAAWRLPVDWPLAAAVAAGGLAVQAAAQVARGRSRTSWRVALGLLLAAAGQALFTQPGCTLPAA